MGNNRRLVCDECGLGNLAQPGHMALGGSGRFMPDDNRSVECRDCDAPTRTTAALLPQKVAAKLGVLIDGGFPVYEQFACLLSAHPKHRGHVMHYLVDKRGDLRFIIPLVNEVKRVLHSLDLAAKARNSPATFECMDGLAAVVGYVDEWRASAGC